VDQVRRGASFGVYSLTYFPDVISVRNVHDRTDKEMPLSDFIARIRATTPFKTPNGDV
jgi:hypothetical protein